MYMAKKKTQITSEINQKKARGIHYLESTCFGKHEDASPIPRIHVKKVGTAVPTCNPSTEEIKSHQSPWTVPGQSENLFQNTGQIAPEEVNSGLSSDLSAHIHT